MTNTQKIEFLLISQSIERFKYDLQKFYALIPTMNMEECYKAMVAIESLKENINVLENKVKMDFSLLRE